MSIDDANKSITSDTELVPTTEGELAEKIVAVTIKLDNPPHTISRPDFERIWLMGYRAAGGTVHPDEASHPITLAQYASGCELQREVVAELRQDLQCSEDERARLQAQLDSRYVDPTIHALLQRVIDGDPGLALASAERKCLERWLARSQVPSKVIAAARAALDQAATDFAELRVSIGLVELCQPCSMSIEHVDREGFDAGLRCSKAIDAIDEAVRT